MQSSLVAGVPSLSANAPTKRLQAAVRVPTLRTRAAAPDVVLPSKSIEMPKYCESTTRTARRPTRTVKVGDILIGSEHPIALQTMTTTDTRDVEATVAQVKQCADAGADLVRITVQGMAEAKACQQIKARLVEDGYSTPLVADIHFQPKVAVLVAECFEKIRVNPGNFADGRKTFEEINYDDPSQFEEERAFIEEKFTPLVLKCKEEGTAMRIGTNHGSLSARILSFYGDTPRGMVESAFEFADICRKHDFHNFLFSMKASNPLVMAQAYRLLAEEMYTRGWDYPMHLGVTEAGEGEDGRMKSAIGIGSLLNDGLGDTIRVSLTEDPEFEMVPCKALADMATAQLGTGVEPFEETTRDVHLFTRRVGELPQQRESDGDVDYRNLLHRDGTVFAAVTLDDLDAPEALYRDLGCKLAVGMPFRDVATADALFLRQLPVSGDAEALTALRRLREVGVHVLAPAAALEETPLEAAVAVLAVRDVQSGVHLPSCSTRFVLTADGTESEEELSVLAGSDADALLYEAAPGVSRVHAGRRLFDVLNRHEVTVPVIHHIRFEAGAARDDVIFRTGAQVGGLLVDGFGDGAMVEVEGEGFGVDACRTIAFGLLQGCRMRNTKTEFVSCPSCGRTLFDLQEVTRDISTRTGHLPGVAIAVMGCIVNGPGEMADADFGYVGGAPGKIDLYVRKDVVRRAIPMETACDELIELIKEHGRWVEPSQDEEEEPALVA